MRRTLTLILTISLIILSGCVSNTEKTCYACEESCSQDVKFCPNCGANLISSDDEFETEQEAIDYSNFGFQNNYGMTEWIKISTHDFSCTSYDSAYVQTRYPHMFIFTNGYIQHRRFEKNYIYKEGNYIEGKLLDTSKCTALDNYTLQIDTKIAYWDDTIEIKSVDIINGIPIINVYDGRSSGDTYMYIPAHFIDTSKDPEYPYGEFNGTQIYFLKNYLITK